MVQKLSEGQYFGKTIQKLDLNGLILTEKIHKIGERLPKHAHENAYFCTVLSGNWLETLNNRERICKPMSMQYHPSDEAHSDDFRNQEAHTFNIELTQKRLNDFSSYSINLNDSLEFYKNEATLIVLKVYQEFKAFDIVSPLAIEGLILEMIASIARNQSERRERTIPIWLMRAQEIIDEGFAERLSLEELAKQVNVHPVHLARTFRKYYRCTLGDFQRRRRIEFACRELSNSDISLVDIALRAGFYDQSHFTRAFKKLMGIPPSKYRSWVLKC